MNGFFFCSPSRHLVCLALACLSLPLVQSAGRPGLFGLAAALFLCALCAGAARRLPVGAAKYDVVAFADNALRFLGLFSLYAFVAYAMAGLVQLAGDFRFGLGSPFPVNLLDGREPSKAWLLSRGISIYPPIDDQTLLVTLYNPVYHLVLAGLSRLFPDLFALARTVNALAGAALLAVLFRLAGGGRGQWPFTALALVVFALSEPFSFVRFTRPDVLAWLLAFSGLALVARLDRDAHRLTALGAGVLLGLAYLTKQQTLPFLLGSAFYLAWRRRFAALLAAGGAALAVTLAALAAEGLLTGGDVFAHTVNYPRQIANNPKVTALGRGIINIGHFFASHAGLSLVYGLFFAQRLRRARPSLVDIVFWVNMPFLCFLMGTWGSDANYFFSAFALVCVSAAGSLAALSARGLWGGALCAAALLLSLAPMNATAPAGPQAAQAPAQALRDRDALAQAVAAAPGPVLADVEGAPAFLGRVAADKLVLYDAVELAALADATGWNLAESQLLRDIRNARFALVVNSPTLHARDYSKILRLHYRLAKTIGPYELFTPRPALGIDELHDLTPGTREGEGVVVQVAQTQNLTRLGGRDCYCAEDKRLPARVTLEARAAGEADRFELGLHAMTTSSNGSVALWQSADGRAFFPLDALPDLGNKSFDTVWSTPVTLRGPWRGERRFFRLELAGDAFVCLNAANPLWLGVFSAAGP